MLKGFGQKRKLCRPAQAMLLAVAICFISACANGGAGADEGGQSGEQETEQASIANPFVDYDSIEEACEAAGFGMIIPETIEGYPKKEISAIKGELVQVRYFDGDVRELLLRKGIGTDDISGDYNEYDMEDTLSIGDREVTIRGNGEDDIRVATWTDGEYSFAIDSDSGLRENELTEIAGLMG